MSASIRGHQGQIKFFFDGGDAKVVNLTSCDINQDSTFIRSKYVGQAVPEGDQSMDGWSGSVDAEVKGPEIDDLIDAVVTDNLNGIGVREVVYTSTELYTDGTTRSYVYSDVQVKMSRKQSGLDSKITKKLDFQSSKRDKVS